MPSSAGVLVAVESRLDALDRLTAPGTRRRLPDRTPAVGRARDVGPATTRRTGELLNSILVELYPERVDDLESATGSDEREEVRPEMPVAVLRRALEARYGWALDVEFERPETRALFLVPLRREGGAAARPPPRGARRGAGASPRDRTSGGGAPPGARASGSRNAGRAVSSSRAPGFRQIVRRIQSLDGSPFAEIRDNLLDRSCEPADLLRGKLAMLGASRFDPKSLLWTRVTFFQGAPLADELGGPEADDWAFPTLGAGAGGTV